MYETAIQGLYTLEYLICMNGILQLKYAKKKVRIAVAISILALSLMVEGSVGFGYFAPLIWMGIRGICILLVFQEKIGKCLLKYLFTVFNMGLIVNPFVVTLTIICRSFGVDAKSEGMTLLSECVQVAILLCVAWILKDKRMLKWHIRKISSPYLAIGLMFGFCADGVTEWGRMVVMQDLTVADQNAYDIVTLGLSELMRLFGIALVVLNELRIQYRKESIMKDQYVNLAEEYGTSMERYGASLRKLRHDMKAHLAAVDFYLEQGDTARAREYLARETGEISHLSAPARDVGNRLINAMITAEQAKMPEGAAIRCEGKLPENGIRLSDYDLCSIFSNLLSNAREACEKLNGSAREIFLWIGEKGEKTLILVENPIEWEVDTEKVLRRTTKKDKEEHGYGLWSVKETVERNGGDMEIRAEDGKFSVYLSL